MSNPLTDRRAAIRSLALTPSRAVCSSELSGSGHHNAAALRRACDEIFRRWSKFLPADQARAQADAFRGRFEKLNHDAVLSESDLDAVLELVGMVMVQG